MPATIDGLDKALKALRKIDPVLSKQLTKEMRPSLRLMQDEARAFVKADIMGLSSWMKANPNAKSRTKRKRAFPPYDPTAARKGIVYSVGAKKNTNNGWVALFSLLNKTASGAIIETAGRKSGITGDPKGKSNNPDAGQHFIDSIERATGALYRTGTSRKSQGRLIFRSVANNRKEFQMTVIDAVNETFRQVAK